MNKLLILLMISSGSMMFAQDKPYYYEIPAAPDVYSPANVVARMVDGLGFRYFWATESLTDKDLAFKPSEDARTSFETLQHIHGLSATLLNTVQQKPNTGGGGDANSSFAELREETLSNIRQASEILKQTDIPLEELPLIFQGSTSSREYPFWNMINGPISDALWHVGQIVTFRRSSGNPLPKGVSVLTGTKRD